MGAKRKVDAKLYEKIKKELKTPKDDPKVMKKYNLGQTAVRAIRNSWCYDDYVLRTDHKKKPVAVDDGYYMIYEEPQVSFVAFYILMAVACFGVVILLDLLVRWIFSWLGI